MTNWLDNSYIRPLDEENEIMWVQEGLPGEIDIDENDLEMGDDLITSALAELNNAPDFTDSDLVIIDDKNTKSEVVSGVDNEETIPLNVNSNEKAELELLRKQVRTLEKQLEQWKSKYQTVIEQQKAKIEKGGQINQRLKKELKDICELRDTAIKEAETNKSNWVEVSSAYMNFQRRSKIKLNEFIEMERATIFRQILPVFDNLKRPLEYTEPSQALLEGVQLIYKQFKEILDGWKISLILSENQMFDPYCHEAVLRVETTEVPPNMVVEVLQEGYCIGNKILRPAKVTVSYVAKKMDLVENIEQSEDSTEQELASDGPELVVNDIINSNIHINSVESEDIAPVDVDDRGVDLDSEEVRKNRTTD
ncbi:nucleotide exchange factor GrpE [bacterium]|nr:nucleotide exchange factor GrpE [bacterium]